MKIITLIKGLGDYFPIIFPNSNVFKPLKTKAIMNRGRKISGGKYHSNRKKRKHERQGQESVVLLGELKRKKVRRRGGDKATITLRSNIVNLTAEGKTRKAEIKNVIETPQNRFLARQNRLMKGVIIETSLGKARITNRPSREGHVNAVLVEK